MADKPNKPKKIKARLPRGLADRGPAEIEATRIMVEAIDLVFERYGFEPVETPAIEYTDVLGKFLPDQDRPNEKFSLSRTTTSNGCRCGMISRHARALRGGKFPEPGDAVPQLSLWLGIPQRETRTRAISPVHAVRCGYCWRCVHGRRRRDVHARGRHDGSAIPRGSYVVKVNNRKILDGAMDALEIPAEKRLTTCGPSISWIGSASKASECFSAKAARMKVATSQRSRADGFPNCGHRGSD